MKKTILLLIILIVPFVFAAAPPSAAFPKEILFFDRLNADELQVKTIENEEIRITSIGLITNQQALRSRIIVQAMPDCPENAPYQTGLLQCFFISQQNLNEKVKELQIHFKVPKEWVERNSYSSVELKRYSYTWNKENSGVLGEWKVLETTKEKEDENYIYYSAYSDGIEYFSIVGMKNGFNAIAAKKEVVTEEPKYDENEEQTKNEETYSENQITGNFAINQEISKSYAILIIFGIVVMAGITALPFTINKETHFEKLVSYIENSKHDEEATINKLVEAGWEEWQIELALKEMENRK